MKINSDDKTMDECRKEAIANYVEATGTEVTQYQDYGQDPVKL